MEDLKSIDRAIQLRDDGKLEEALSIIKNLVKRNPDIAELNYQAAWTFDLMGKEKEAVIFYEKAVENGLSGESLRGALLGLGSTYRCLGRYEKSLTVFNRAILTFPEDRSFKVFKALTDYNLGNYSESINSLLLELIDTTSNKDIKKYEKALRFYKNRLDEVWN